MLDILQPKHLTSAVIATALVPLFCFFMIFMIISAVGVSSSKTVTTLEAYLSSDEGYKTYNEILKPVISEVAEETHVIVDFPSVIAPFYCQSGKKKIAIDKKNIKTAAMLTLKKENNSYTKLSIENYLKVLHDSEEFKNISTSSMRVFINENNDFSNMILGNFPQDFVKLKNSKPMNPMKSKFNFYDIGMYKPFEDQPWTMHYGMDIGSPEGTELYASINGRVTYNHYDEIGGNTFMISNDNLTFVYCHMQKLSSLTVGSLVKKGDKIGLSGASGHVTGAHLHFQACNIPMDRAAECIYYDVQPKVYFNPQLLIDLKSE